MNREQLKVLYIDKLKTVKEIAQEMHVPDAAIYRALVKFNIKRTKEQINTVRKKTNIKIYGTENVNQNKKIRKKGASTYRNQIIQKYDLELMKEMYLKQNKTTEQISKDLNINVVTVRKLFRNNNIVKDKSCVNQQRQANMHKSIREKYGVDNIQLSKSVREKTIKTCLERYGVAYAVKTKESFLKSIETKRKKWSEETKKILSSKENLEQFIISLDDRTTNNICSILGIDGTTLWRTFLKRWDLISLIDQNTQRMQSRAELELIDYVKEIYKGEVIESCKTALQKNEDHPHIDIYLPQKKIGIEYNGSYWHRTEGRKYTPKMKTQLAVEKGIRLIHIYDYEWFNNKETIKKFLYYLINRRKQRFLNIQDLTLKEIDKQTFKQFLEENHWFGGSKLVATVCYGLFTKDGELVSGTSFNKFSGNKYDWEWKRYCNKLGVAINGGAPERFLEEFSKNHHGKLVDYQQMDRFTSTSSERMGFKKLRWVEGYVSVNNYTYAYVRHRFIPEDGLTSLETMQKYGYDVEVPNAGVITWVKEI